MKCYKGFDADLKCRDFQYEVGKTYETDKAELCKSGFHFCEAPLEVFNYYPPSVDGKLSRYCEVEAEDVSDEKDVDSKRVSKKLSVGAEIGIPGLVKAHIEYVKERTGKGSTNTGDRSVATNTGNQSVATNTGDQSVATNTGNQSVATNTGDQSVATNTGFQSVATNTGLQSVATNTGFRSVATNTGNRSVATNTGFQSVATNTGDQSFATNTGNQSASIVEGKDSIAMACGYQSKAKACIGSAIVIAERGEWKLDGGAHPLIAIKAAIVDGKTLKADTWYTLKNGEFVEVDE